MPSPLRPRFNLTGYLSGRPRPLLALLLCGMFAGITLLEYSSPSALRLSPLYVLVVAYATWFLNPRWGVLTALAAASAMFVVQTLPRHVPRDLLTLSLNGSIDIALFLAFVFILGEVQALYGRERELSRADSLTGLLNRRAFAEALEVELQRMHRVLRPMTLVYFDLDNFKLVNDRVGHAEGDRLLLEVAATMQQGLRRVDVPARLGGDEFAIVLSETDEAAARSVVEKLTAQLLASMQQHGWPVTFSVGAVTFQQPMTSADDMVRLADQTMYSVKQSGKGRIAYHVWNEQSKAISVDA
jgi:diguanylate cyclase (GGDEF)-like protein